MDGLLLSAGLLTAPDGLDNFIAKPYLLNLINKAITIICADAPHSCVWSGDITRGGGENSPVEVAAGATLDLGVAYIFNTGGLTTTLLGLTVRDGSFACIEVTCYGGGLLIYRANTLLVLVLFANNSVGSIKHGGGAVNVESGLTTFRGCTFIGNEAYYGEQWGGIDDVHVMGDGESVFEGCPAGYSSINYNWIIIYILNNPNGEFATSVQGNYTCEACGEEGTSSELGDSTCGLCEPGRFSQGEGEPCVTCQPGRYQEEEGTSYCKDCPKGKSLGLETVIYLLLNGNAANNNNNNNNNNTLNTLNTLNATAPTHHNHIEDCTSCTPGRYNNATGVAVCSSCAKGTISGPGALSCVSCTLGKYSEVVGGDNCPECAAGKYSMLWGAESRHECVSCHPGTCQPYPGSTACEPCGPGKYASGTGSVQCEECPPGKSTSSGQEGSEDCEDCIVGKFQLKSGGSDDCEECEMGMYSDVRGMPMCISCPAGKLSMHEREGGGGIAALDIYGNGNGNGNADNISIANITTNFTHNVCISCPTGKISGLRANSCIPCEKGKFNDVTNSSVCEMCDNRKLRSDTLPGVSGATSDEECHCMSGWYLNKGGTECVETFEGVVGDVPRATLERLPLESGYWRTGKESIELKECMVKDACVGGNDTESYCLEGHAGPYCDVCVGTFSKVRMEWI